MGVAPGIPGTGFAVPLNANEFPSDIGLAGVLVRASSAALGCMAGISGIPPGGVIGGAGVGLTVVGAPNGGAAVVDGGGGPAAGCGGLGMAADAGSRGFGCEVGSAGGVVGKAPVVFGAVAPPDVFMTLS